MRKTKIKKVSKQPISKIQRQIWEECKRIIRARYVLPDESWICYTCNKKITYKTDAHTSHFIPKSTCGAYLKYDLRNLRVTCMTCNVWLGGNGAMFYRNMVEREGQEYVDEIFRDKHKTIKAYDFFVELLAKYKQIEK